MAAPKRFHASVRKQVLTNRTAEVMNGSLILKRNHLKLLLSSQARRIPALASCSRATDACRKA